jgi:hypothetical protein
MTKFEIVADINYPTDSEEAVAKMEFATPEGASNFEKFLKAAECNAPRESNALFISHRGMPRFAKATGTNQTLIACFNDMRASYAEEYNNLPWVSKAQRLFQDHREHFPILAISIITTDNTPKLFLNLGTEAEVTRFTDYLKQNVEPLNSQTITADPKVVSFSLADAKTLFTHFSDKSLAILSHLALEAKVELPQSQPRSGLWGRFWGGTPTPVSPSTPAPQVGGAPTQSSTKSK